MCGLMSDLVICKHRKEYMYGYTRHWMFFLRLGVIKQHKIQILQDIHLQPTYTCIARLPFLLVRLFTRTQFLVSGQWYTRKVICSKNLAFCFVSLARVTHPALQCSGAMTHCHSILWPKPVLFCFRNHLLKCDPVLATTTITTTLNNNSKDL